MKFVVFGPAKRLGLLQKDVVLDLARAAEVDAAGAPEGSFNALLNLIEAGDRGLDAAKRLADRFGADEALTVRAEGLQLHAPYPGRRMALAGTNFAAHVANARTNFGQPVTAEEIYAKSREGTPTGFWCNSIPVGPGAEIPVPRSAKGLFDYEAEVGIVLGKGGKRLQPDKWREHVWGVTLIIDWSIRPETFPGGGPMPFYGHKSFDGSKSIGPCIVVGEVDPADCQVQTLVNGELRQDFNNGDMIHSYGEILAQLTTDLTFHPGDVVSGGTGPGTAMDASVPGPDRKTPLDLMVKPGDLVEVRSPLIGSLNARIIESD